MEELSQSERAFDSVRVRKWRSTFTRYADETDSGHDTLEWSETPLHKGHEFELSETLMDNPAEGTMWAYCQTCKDEFWFSSWEVDW